MPALVPSVPLKLKPLDTHERYQEEEDRTEEAMDSMERKYWEGQVDALSHVYSTTYALSFAIEERARNRG